MGGGEGLDKRVSIKKSNFCKIRNIYPTKKIVKNYLKTITRPNVHFKDWPTVQYLALCALWLGMVHNL